MLTPPRGRSSGISRNIGATPGNGVSNIAHLAHITMRCGNFVYHGAHKPVISVRARIRDRAIRRPRGALNQRERPLSLNARSPFSPPSWSQSVSASCFPWRNQMTSTKLLSAGLITAAMLATPAMAQEGRVAPRQIAAAHDAGAAPGALYIDGRLCYPAPRVGAFATQPWTNTRDVPCEPTPGYY